MLSQNISLKSLIKRFWKKTVFTWVLVVLEGLSLVMMPMVIGWAVDGLMNKSWSGIIQLAGLSIFLLIIGSARRLYDTRAYAGIYRTVTNELVDNERRRKTNLSKISARVNLFTEFIEFLEMSMPTILQLIISILGTLIIILFINPKVLLVCFIAVVLTMVVYAVSERRIYHLNSGRNDEVEKQVDILETKNKELINGHFKKLMGWQIKLSDLETLNFSIIWIVLGAALIYTIVLMASAGNSSIGQILAVIMYVFAFIDDILNFPLHYQQMVRLQEISSRLSSSANNSAKALNT